MLTIAGGILLAIAFLGIGCVIAGIVWFIGGWLWIAFGPNEDRKMAKMYRKKEKERAALL